jgi:hypothetical protein
MTPIIKKQRVHICYKGMIPIIKNISVTDTLGQEYEPTYLRRAKGLVKNGRARWVDENKICLACPPNIETEDTLMENITNINLSDKMVEENNQPIQLSMEYILNKINQIVEQNQYIYDALESIKTMPVNETQYGGSPDCKGEAIADVVKSRETTNQQIICFLEKMYDDIKPKEKAEIKDVELQKFDVLSQILKGINADEYNPEVLGILKRSAQQMFVHPGSEIVRN